MIRVHSNLKYMWWIICMFILYAHLSQLLKVKALDIINHVDYSSTEGLKKISRDSTGINFEVLTIRHRVRKEHHKGSICSVIIAIFLREDW